MTSGKRLAVAPIVAFGLAFAVVLALGQFLSSSLPAEETSQSRPQSEPSQSPPQSEPSQTSSTQGTSAPPLARTYELGPLLQGATSPDPRLDELEPKVWSEGGRQVHVCVRVPEGWRLGSSGWTHAAGPVHCRSATSGESLELTLVAS